MARLLVLFCAVVAAVSAFPAEDPVIRKLVPDGPRYNYAQTEDGGIQLVDSWVKVSDLEKSARYNPDTDNEYHLFTRANPTLSQPIVWGDVARLQASNFDPSKRTVVCIHGFLGSGTAGSNQALVPAYLAGEDVNVIVVDWSRGATWGLNGIQAGGAIGRFINWVNSVTGATPSQYHIMGFSVGGHTAGVTARAVSGQVGYVTGLDPASRWEIDEIISPNDAAYVEVIHTSAGVNGWAEPLGHTDFYPNGGNTMPGCLVVNIICDHQRSYEYMAESVAASGPIFTGIQCQNHQAASIGSCNLAGRLNMGGRVPKTGLVAPVLESTGIYFLRTNRSSPFNQG